MPNIVGALNPYFPLKIIYYYTIDPLKYAPYFNCSHKYLTNALRGVAEVHKYIIIIIWVNHYRQRVEITIPYHIEVCLTII